MLDNDRNSATTSVRAVLQRRETPKSARRPKERDPERSETRIDWLARTRVSIRIDFALAVLGVCQ